MACASRTCRALASPYFFRQVKCEFKELKRIDILGLPPVVVLSTKDNFKTLTFHRTPYRTENRSRTISQVLSVDNTYDCFEYLPNKSLFHFDLSAPALDLLSHNLPLLSKMVIDLDEFMGYSTSWDRAFKKALGRRALSPLEIRYLSPPVSHTDGLDMIRAMARFENLRNLTLHYKLRREEATLMHPTPGCQAACEVYESIQREKRGHALLQGEKRCQALLQLDVVFHMHSTTFFGRRALTDHKTISNKMTITCDEKFLTQSGTLPRCRSTCDNPHFGKVVERRWRTESFYGELAWTHRLGGIHQELLHGKYKSLPWSVVMESAMWLVMLPSHVVLENGQRLRYEPSLTKAEMSDLICCSGRPRRFTDKILQKILLYSPFSAH